MYRREALRYLSCMAFLPLCRSVDVAALQSGMPSRTARGTALHRAAHQLLDTPLVFDDPIAIPALGAKRAAWLHANLDRYRTGRARAMRAFLVTRSRYAEDELERSYGAGTRQYLVLGAGLDTFACRNPYPDLAVFEVDHPATQAWKRAHLAQAGLAAAPSLTYVPVDFETNSLGRELRAAGFDSEAPAFISWLGVTMYLTSEAVMQTLSYVATSSAPGTSLVFDFSVPASALGERERAARLAAAERVARLGEPWLSAFDPDELVERLHALGYSHAGSFGAAEANERYFAGRSDGLRYSGSARIMTARV